MAETLAEGAQETCSVIEGNCFDTEVPVPDPSANDPVVVSVSNGEPAGTDVVVTDPVASDAGPIDGSVVPDSSVAAVAPQRFAVGDSVMLGAADELVADGFLVDAEESRSFVRGIDVVQALADSGQLPNQLVIHLGTNGPITQAEMDQMMAVIAPVPQVVLIRNDVDRDYAEQNNTLMVNAAAANPNVSVLYWDGLAAQCQGDCIYQDGIHLKSTGAAYYVQLINGVLAA